MSDYLKCSGCLRRLSPPDQCVHPMLCFDLGWLGRARAFLFGWPKRHRRAEEEHKEAIGRQPLLGLSEIPKGITGGVSGPTGYYDNNP